LGTTYERFVLHEYFRRIRDRYGVGTVLEAPVFGMTGLPGINSMWWAMEGAQVTLVDHSSVRLDAINNLWQEISLKVRLVYDPGTYASLLFEDKEFDMSWNFAALHPELKLEILLRELIRITREVIFICVPNRMNPFTRVCSMLKGRGKVVQLRGMDPGTIQRIMRNNGWQVKDKGFLDVPPWPDIAMSKEDAFRKIGLKQYAKHLRANITEEGRICILDYYSGRNKKMKQEMGRYGFLENSPNWLKTIWAHHRYFVFSPRHPL